MQRSRRVAWLVVVVLIMLGTANAQENGGDRSLGAPKSKISKLTATKRKIIVPMEGITDFVVTGRAPLIRLTVSTIAGGSIKTPKTMGNIRHVRTTEIVTVDKDGRPLIGAIVKEFLFRGTGKGRATIEITKTLPTQPMPIVKRYTVTLK